MSEVKVLADLLSGESLNSCSKHLLCPHLVEGVRGPPGVSLLEGHSSHSWGLHPHDHITSRSLHFLKPSPRRLDELPGGHKHDHTIAPDANKRSTQPTTGR